MFSWKLFSLLVSGLLMEVRWALGDSVKNTYFNPCSRSSPDFGSCIKESITEAKPKLIKGIPEIGFPALEPMIWASYDFKEDNHQFKLNVQLTDFSVIGLSNLTVDNVQVSGNLNTGMTINLTIASPTLRVSGDWSGKGRALNFYVDGNGKWDVNLTNTDFKLSIKGSSKVNKDNGKKYFSVHGVTLDPILRKAHVYVTNLFPNDLNLNKMTNKFINRNIKFILRITKHYPAKYIGAELEKLIKIVFNTWPIDELMLD